jgi:hypothetical protein
LRSEKYPLLGLLGFHLYLGLPLKRSGLMIRFHSQHEILGILFAYTFGVISSTPLRTEELTKGRGKG